MQFGIETFIADETMIPGEKAIDPIEFAQAAEERGFESLFIAEHTHVPVNSDEYPFDDSDSLPNYYYSMPDLIVTLTAMAMRTERLRLGTGVALVAMHDPIIMAKEIATLDVVSGGRLVLGIGAGWNSAEAPNHGIDRKSRFGAMREKVQAMTAIWTQDIAEYHGKYVNFDPLYSRPKPLQKPHPPILMGGWAESVLKRIADYCDGWFAPSMWKPSQVAPAYKRLCGMMEERGKPRPRLNIFFPTDEDKAEIDVVRELEPDRAMFYTHHPTTRDTTLRMLDEWAVLIDRYQ
ncbi:MAG: LLM class F420-dependent oxidoreductase [Streptosporangiaceae bacterium]|nr:LLM class F420-dependent oxidoreductase [Streptosporangiaceae bacterium]